MLPIATFPMFAAGLTADVNVWDGGVWSQPVRVPAMEPNGSYDLAVNWTLYCMVWNF